MSTNIIASEKKSYQRQFQALCNQFLKKANASLFLKKHSKLVDSLLIKLWIKNDVSKKIRSLLLVVMAGMNYFLIQMLTYWSSIMKKVWKMIKIFLNSLRSAGILV